MNTLLFSTDAIPQTYAELAAVLMPRPLHSDQDYRNALKILDAMTGHPMNADQQDYFEAIATFVEHYELVHDPADPFGLTDTAASSEKRHG